MLVILPFEKEYYKTKWNWDVDYVGHPLIEVVENAQLAADTPRFSSKPIVALLPGSRRQEILKKLPIMLEVSRMFPTYQFIVAKAPAQEDSFYESLLTMYPNVSSVRDATYPLLLQS